MDPIFPRSTIHSIPDLLAILRPVRFPESKHITGKEVVALKRDIRHNCEMLCNYAFTQLRESPLSDDMQLNLKLLLRDAYATRSECSKVSVNFLGPRHGRIVTRLRKTYDDTRLAAILVCQQREPAFIDSLTVAL